MNLLTFGMTLLAVGGGGLYWIQYYKFIQKKQDDERKRLEDERKEKKKLNEKDSVEFSKLSHIIQNFYKVTKIIAPYKDEEKMTKFLISYAWLRSREFYSPPLLQDAISVDRLGNDLEIVEVFRRSLMTFYKDASLVGSYPAYGDMYMFVTIHWLFYQTNGICKEPEILSDYVATRGVHEKVMRVLSERHPSSAEKAKVFQEIWKNKFVNIHENVWALNVV